METETIERHDLEERLRTLEQEYETGRRMLRENELQREQLEQTVIRIDGAMTVLRELLDGSENGGGSIDTNSA